MTLTKLTKIKTISNKTMIITIRMITTKIKTKTNNSTMTNSSKKITIIKTNTKTMITMIKATITIMITMAVTKTIRTKTTMVVMNLSSLEEISHRIRIRMLMIITTNSSKM